VEKKKKLTSLTAFHQAARKFYAGIDQPHRPLCAHECFVHPTNSPISSIDKIMDDEGIIHNDS